MVVELKTNKKYIVSKVENGLYVCKPVVKGEVKKFSINQIHK